MRPVTKMSWRPTLRGSSYCSSACGRGCTYLEYSKAKKQATRLALRLGSEWTPVVFENLGWWWRVRSPNKQIEVYKTGRLFFANVARRFIGHGCTPEAAVNRAKQRARKELATLTNSISEAL